MQQAIAIAIVIGAPIAASAQLAIVDDRQGLFRDIREFGIPLGLADDEERQISFSRSNPLFLPGSTWVGNNGGIGFGIGFKGGNTELDPNNQPIPSGNAFGGEQSLLPFWDDPGSDSGNVWVADFPDRTIVQWDRSFDGTKGPTQTGSWQVQIFDASLHPGEILAQFIYRDIEQSIPNGGAIATIGYQDGNRGFNDVQWSFNQANAVQNGTVLSLIYVPAPGSAALLLGAALAGAGRRRR